MDRVSRADNDPAERIDTLLLLLHGVWGSHCVWPLKGGAHLTAQRILDASEIGPMVIAMPSDGLTRDGSGCLTSADGCDVERWIVEEVPALAQIAAPALKPDAKIAIAGLLRGGCGALRLGSKSASRFSAIAAHSVITEIDDLAEFVEEPLSEYLACAPREELDALYWMRRTVTSCRLFNLTVELPMRWSAAIAGCMMRLSVKALLIDIPNMRAATSGPTGSSTSGRPCATSVATAKKRTLDE